MAASKHGASFRIAPNLARPRVVRWQAIDEMVARRLLLQEDAPATLDRLLRAGRATGAIQMDAWKP